MERREVASALLQALSTRLVGITSPHMDPGSWFRKQGGLAAGGLHLGQPLLHTADVTVQPPGAAQLGQIVFLVSQQAALWSVQRAERCLQWGHSTQKSVEKCGARVPQCQPCPCWETAAGWLHQASA